jgi:hypothetical protein
MYFYISTFRSQFIIIIIIISAEVSISKLVNTCTSISNASSENNCEDDFTGSDDNFPGIYMNKLYYGR